MERQELHDKLEQAREELLNLKKNACKCEIYIFEKKTFFFRLIS